MLSELHIQNLAVLEDVKLDLGPGMTVLSGDEGAGKSLIIDALGVLLGARVPAGIVRTGCSSARIEGVFWPTQATTDRLRALLSETAIEIELEGALIISREIQEQGRSLTRVNGRAVPMSLLKQVGQCIVDIYGQMDYLSLLDARHQLDLLDSFGNLIEMREKLSRLIDDFRQKGNELSELGNAETQGRLELLKFQVEEIDRAKLNDGEEESLLVERDILRRAGTLQEGCAKIYGTLHGESRAATTLVHNSLGTLKGLAGIDPSLSGYGDRLEEAIANLEDIAREVRGYGEAIELGAGRIDEVEQRLDLLSSLKRKYGPTIESIQAFASKAGRELEDAEKSEERRTSLEKARALLEGESARLAVELSAARKSSAEALAQLVNGELVELGLPSAIFDISLTISEDRNGLPLEDGTRLAFNRDGVDQIEFVVSTNPGEPAKALHTVASGGETCRIMLALKSALKQSDPVPTLVFDEIDIGIGGRGADTVARKMANLAAYHQVICVTHLPQVACFGDAHFKLVKDVGTKRASTHAEVMSGQKRIKELAAMLGSNQAGEVMAVGAGELLTKAESWKKHREEGTIRDLIPCRHGYAPATAKVR